MCASRYCLCVILHEPGSGVLKKYDATATFAHFISGKIQFLCILRYLNDKVKICRLNGDVAQAYTTANQSVAS